MPVTHEADHAGKLVARLTENLRDIPEVVAWLGCYAGELQLLEDVFRDLREKMGLNGEGAQLDQVGKLVLEERGGDADPAYLLRLRAAIRARKSSGTLQDLLDVFATMFPGNRIWFPVAGGGDLELVVGSVGSTTNVPAVSRLARRAKDAGAMLQVDYWVDDDAHTFTFRAGSYTASALAPGASAFGLLAYSAFAQGDLVAVAPGTATAELHAVVYLNPPGNVIQLDGLTNAQDDRTEVTRIARDGEHAALTGATLAGATSLPFAGGHPFQVGDELVVEPTIPGKQDPTVVTGITGASVSVAALTYAHASGARVAIRSHEGFGSVNDATAGGGLAGTVES